MNEKVDANEVIAELQSDIAEKALQIAILKAQITDLSKTKEKDDANMTSSEEVEGGNQ